LIFDSQGQLRGRAISPEPYSSLVYPEPRRVTRHSPLSSSEAKSESAAAFSGVHVISPRLLPLLDETGVFSIIDSYVRLAAQGQKILAFRADQYYWRDLGRSADLAQAALDLRRNPLP